MIFGCGIERDNIFGIIEGFDEGGNEGDSGSDEVSGIDEVSGGARGNQVDPIGLFLLDNVSRTEDEMNCRFRLGGSNDRVLKDADSRLSASSIAV